MWDGAGEGKSAGIHGLQVPEYASTSPMRISIEVLEGSGSGSGVVGSGGERYEMVGPALVELDVVRASRPLTRTAAHIHAIAPGVVCWWRVLTPKRAQLLATPGRTRWMPFVPAATMRVSPHAIPGALPPADAPPVSWGLSDQTF